MTVWKDIAEAVKDFVTAGGIIGGGLFTYYKFRQIHHTLMIHLIPSAQSYWREPSVCRLQAIGGRLSRWRRQIAVAYAATRSSGSAGSH
jgi:hypothetical protein